MSYKVKTLAGTGLKTFGEAASPAVPHFPTIPPEDEVDAEYHDTAFKREGITMGIISQGKKLVWKLQWSFLTATEVGYIQDWEDLRYFQFSPDSGTTYYNVLATGNKTAITGQRGNRYNYTLTLKEV